MMLLILFRSISQEWAAEHDGDLENASKELLNVNYIVSFMIWSQTKSNV